VQITADTYDYGMVRADLTTLVAPMLPRLSKIAHFGPAVIPADRDMS
jgi:hypothetical protein